MNETNQPGIPEQPEPAPQAEASATPPAVQPEPGTQAVEPPQVPAAPQLPNPPAPPQVPTPSATQPDLQPPAPPVDQQQWVPAPPVAPNGTAPQQWAPQPGAPGAHGVPYGQPAAGAIPPKRGLPKWALWLIIGGSAAILAIIALVVVLVIVVNAGGPKGTANDYLQSLSSGKVATANKIARIDGDKRLALLGSDAYAKSKHATDYQLTSISQRDDLALASTSYKVDGSTVRGTFELRKDDKGWYVSRGLTAVLPSVYGSTGAEGYRLAGYDGLITSDLRLEAYPGVYTAEAPNKYFEFEEPFTFEIGGSYASRMNAPKLVPSQVFADEVDAQLKTHIDECVKTVTDQFSVRKCGIAGYPSKLYDVQKSTVVVKSYPKVTVGQYRVELEQKGSATVTYTGKKIGGGEGSETVETDFERLIFSSKFEDGKPSLTFY